MKRKLALDALRVAGFENDRRAFVRLYVENRVSIETAERAWREGRRVAEGRRGEQTWRIRSLFNALWEGAATGDQNALDRAHRACVKTFGLAIFVERCAP
jgi:hypothetical protein